MTPFIKKRFWTSASVVATDGGFGINLDDRSVQTPAKTRLVVPVREIAELIAAEWEAQVDQIDPVSMPTTRWANAAIDKVAMQVDGVVDMLASYGGSDLLCYRAAEPGSLVNRQAEAWDPVLTWAAKRYDAPLVSVVGVIPFDQPNQSLSNLRRELLRFDAFQLAAVHDLVTISGSLLLALAVSEQRLTPEVAWAAAQIDEVWQKELWGEDEEAKAAAAAKQEAFIFAHELLQLLH
ncbi:MAG: ATPase [Rhodobacteraceae bacterium]|nr:ATPase [Paracoccaceae bacterium]